MHKSAKRILEKLNKLEGTKYTSIDELMKCREYSKYKLIITGHSLGAGVASVLAFLLYQSKDYLRERIICYAFSPPGCVFRFVIEMLYYSCILNNCYNVL